MSVVSACAAWLRRLFRAAPPMPRAEELDPHGRRDVGLPPPPRSAEAEQARLLQYGPFW